ncbi:precorrin-6y C5,15-methyltransferase (decarboxylating) subunit CbiE [Gordonia sp. NPDC003424]
MSAQPDSPATCFVVIGIGADGWGGLSERARSQLRGAEVVYGSRRQLDLLEPLDATLIGWHSPMSTHLASVLSSSEHPTVHVLASGDPMFHGIGTSIVRELGAQRVTVIPASSSVSLACAHLGWDLTSTRVVSAVTGHICSLATELTDGRRIIVLSRSAETAAEATDVLNRHGYGWSSVTVLEQLGGPREREVTGLARSWRPVRHDPLNLVAIECVGPHRSILPGLADDEYDHDGQITKSAFRALTVTALRPGGRQLLWDIGSGSGSVAIEWLRVDAAGHCVAFEKDPARAARIVANAHRHGVCDSLTVRGAVPDELAGAPDPDAVFIGGGLDEPVLQTAWTALLDGGRLVANAVTLETQEILARWHRARGGTLRRIAIETAEPLGSMTTWRPSLPIVQWVVDKS